MNGLFNPFHCHDSANDSKEIFEWIDAGIFTGDMLYLCNVEEFENYIGRWQRAIENHKKIETEEKTNDNQKD